MNPSRVDRRSKTRVCASLEWRGQSLLDVSVPSDSDEELEAERGRDVQRLQAESGGRVREEDGERVLGVDEELRRIVSVLKTTLDT